MTKKEPEKREPIRVPDDLEWWQKLGDDWKIEVEKKK